MSQVLNLNNMIPIPPELLACMTSDSDAKSSSVSTSTSLHEAAVPDKVPAPVIVSSSPQAVLPSTPPPPPSSNSTATITTSVKTDRPISSSPDQQARVHASSVGMNGIRSSLGPVATLSTTPRPAAHGPIGGLAATGAQTSLEDHTNQEEKTNEGPSAAKKGRDLATESQPITSTPARKRKKIEKLPRFPLESDDNVEEEHMNGQISAHFVPSPEHQHYLQPDPYPSSLVQATFINDTASSPEKNGNAESSNNADDTVVAAPSFYGTRTSLFRPPSPALNKELLADYETETALGTRAGALNHSNVHSNINGEHKRTASVASSTSGDGFEFISVQTEARDASPPRIKSEEMLPSFDDHAHTLEYANSVRDFFAWSPEGEASVSKETSTSAPLPEITLQLARFTQQEVRGLLDQVKSFTRENRSKDRDRSTSPSGLMHANATPSVQQPLTSVPSSDPKTRQSATSAGTSTSRRQSTLRSLALQRSLPLDASRKPTRSTSGTPRQQIIISSSPKVEPVTESRRSNKTNSSGIRSGAGLSASTGSASGASPPKSPSQDVANARKSIAGTTETIKSELESKGLTRRQSIDLW